ncbi:MAG TPA: hypothetical protein VMT34_11870 [Aggregatilineales bacterium]|nr:hypothetical protein [Aggregatilineales bacterium]
MPYQVNGTRRSSVQFGVGRTVWVGSPAPAVPEMVLDGLPGFIAWLSLLFVIVGSIQIPTVIFVLATAVAMYNAGRMALAGIANLMGLRYINRWEKTDWRVEYERRRTADSLAWDDVLHVIAIPNHREELSILRQTLDRLAMQPLAKTQVAVVMAMEAGEPSSTTKADALRAEYASKFRHFVVTLHPKGLSSELQGKSANEAWAIRSVKRQLVADMGYDIDRIIITICDADSLIHPHFIDCLTCLFATSDRRHATVWQAPIRYHSNIWDIHPALGLVHAYSAAWELAYLAAPWWDPMPISTYSLSMRMADEVGYWDTDVIAEDWHMFIKCFFRRGGKLQLGRIYLPFSGHAVTGDTFLEACKNRYSQTLRHAWGAKEIGYTIGQMIERPEVSFWRSLQLVLRVAHDSVMASAGIIMLTLGTGLPLLLHPTLLTSQMLPVVIVLQVVSVVVALLGMVFWRIDLSLRPPRPHPWTVKEAILTLLSFPLLPILTLIFMTVPVMQAQTRLLLGMPIQYRVARKV